MENNMQMLLQFTTEKRKMEYKYFDNVQLKNQKEMQVLLQSITVERKIKCDSFSINNWKTKNKIQILLQSTTSKRKKGMEVLTDTKSKHIQKAKIHIKL